MPALPPDRPDCPAARRARPLPDPAAVRLCLIPDPAPPFDGELKPPPPGSGRTPPGSGRTPGREAPPGGPEAPPGGPEAPPGGGSGDGWPGRFAQVLAETLAGSRPPRQIVPWTTERARSHIQRLGAQLSSAQQPRVRRVITFRPTLDVVEMTVVVGFGPRVRALAVRLEREPAGPAGGSGPGAPARWLCTAVEAA